MSTFFSLGEKKTRPAVYKRYENAGGIATAGLSPNIVLAIVKGNWGTPNKPVEFEYGESVEAIVGTGTGKEVIDIACAGGARQFIIVRVGNGGTPATVTLKDTASGSSADVLKLTAKCPGTRPLSVTVKASLSDEAIKEVILYDGTKALETFRIDAGSKEVDAIVTAMADSKYVTASKVANGNGSLALVSQKTLTGGTEPTVNAEAYAEALASAECMVSDTTIVITDSEDSAIHTLVKNFIDRIYEEGAYPLAFVAEANSVEYDTKIAHAKAYNDEKMHYVLNGSETTAGEAYEGYKIASLIAGVVAGTESNQSITHKVLSGMVGLTTTYTNRQVEKAIESGCIVLTLNKSRQVQIEAGINTLVTISGEKDEGWKKIRRVKERFELMNRIEKTVEPIIAVVDNDSDGRAAVIAAAQRVVDEMVGEKKIIAGAEVALDSRYAPHGDSAWFVIYADDVDSLEKIYLTFRFRFSANV